MNNSFHCRIIFFTLLILLAGPFCAGGEEFEKALPGKIFSFPRDHFSHPQFKTEWWYYSGHLQSQGNDRSPFGFQLTFFRSGLKREAKEQKSKWAIQNLYFAHLALTDESRQKFDYRQKISRGSLGEAGASDRVFRIWIDDWSVEGKGPNTEEHLLKAGDKEFGIELRLLPEKKPVVHGKNGISQKGEGTASHYYSITRLKTAGNIFLKGRVIPVEGASWMDHEFGSAQLRQDQVGWDWFSIRMEDGTDLMLYRIRRKGGSPDPYSSGTILLPDGTQRTLSLKDFRIDVLEQWKSKKSGGTYPSKWRVTIPQYQMELVLSPTVKDQELITEESTRVTYWEGSVWVEGKAGDKPVKGMGYAELTGYAEPFSKGI